MNFKEFINPFAFVESDKSIPYEEVGLFVTVISLIVLVTLSLGGFIFWAMPLELLRGIVASMIMAYAFNFLTFLREIKGK
jgi:hypothetical protein